jgi:hypothetical protein
MRRGAVLPVGAVRISMMPCRDTKAVKYLGGREAEEECKPGPDGVPRAAMTLHERPRWGCLQFRGAPRVQHLCRPTTVAFESNLQVYAEQCEVPLC